MLDLISLSGLWRFALDPSAVGVAEGWFNSDLNDTIALPGSVDMAEKAPLSTEVTASHLSRRHPYVGPAWYARTFEVPAGMEDHFFHIALERPHGEVNIWLDGIKLGRDESLSTAVRMFAGSLTAGTHRIVMMIDNSRFQAVGEALSHDTPNYPDVAHSTTDHTQTNWNGVAGYLRVEAARASIARVDVHAPSRDIRVKIELDAFDDDIYYPTFWSESRQDELLLTVELAGGEVIEHRLPVTIDSGFTEVRADISLPETAGLWDEFSPVIHRLQVQWIAGGKVLDQSSTDFGIRSFTAKGRHLLLNGRRVSLRGTLDCAIFPLTGFPPTDHAGWEKVLGTVAEHGLNHVRFHSWCPPKAAFEVADRLGILLHVETPIWAILGADPALDQYINAEAERIIRDYGNHPSFVMFCVGNEVHGAGLHAFLERFIAKWQRLDDRRVYTGGSGWPTVKRADYISKPEPRSQRWNEGMDGRLNARPLETRTDWRDYIQSVPMAMVSHEIGQWCVYPNYDEIPKFSGPLEARNLMMFRDDLAAKGMGHLADAMHNASGALQVQLYKEDIEASLRTPDMAGFQLLGLQDFPGQGTALVGMVNSFWDPKSYLTADAFREFCAPVVPLLRADGFVVTEGQPITADVQLSVFTAEDLTGAQLGWELIDAEGQVQRQGVLPAVDLATGDLHDIGAISIDTTGLPSAARYELVVSLVGSDYRNRWHYWIMPAHEAPHDLPIVHDLDASILDRIEAGETVILSPDPARIRENAALGHTAAFWNTLWTCGQKPHTLGLLIDKAHPLFKAFPTDSHSDWHWWEMTFGRRAFPAQGLPRQDIVRVIDDWNQNRDLILCAELAIGKGRLILAGFDLESDLENRPVARTFRAALASHLEDNQTAAPAVSRDTVAAWWDSATA